MVANDSSTFVPPISSARCWLCPCSADPPVMLRPWFIHSLGKTPAKRECPIAESGLPCPCRTKGVSGIHTPQWDYIVDQWVESLPRSSSLLLDLLRAHLSAASTRALFDHGVQPLFMYPGELRSRMPPASLPALTASASVPALDCLVLVLLALSLQPLRTTAAPWTRGSLLS